MQRFDLMLEAGRPDSRDASSGPPRASTLFAGGRRAFSLLEVMIVVAMIALLAALLLPSLATARAQARMMQCQNNVRQLASAFAMYSVGNRSRLPGFIFDYEADWLGAANVQVPRRGRSPEDGTIFRYVGRDRRAYACPEDTQKRASSSWVRSYSGHMLLSGAQPERLAGAHYRASTNYADPLNYSETDHTAHMRPFDGVPMIIEEHPKYYLQSNDDGGWCNGDRVADRHFFALGKGWASFAFTDTHASRVQLPATPLKLSKTTQSRFFYANTLCVRTANKKWVTGRSWSSDGPAYGLMDRVLPAEAFGVRH